MQEFITSNLLWTHGIYILMAIGIVALLGLLFWRTACWAALIFFCFSFYFFRNPVRVCKQALYDPTVLICPADGTVVDTLYDTNNNLEGFAQRVSIFLSPLDVHVQWAPTKGLIEDIKYVKGDFSFAFLPKSSLLNEHNDLIINNKFGTIKVRQIAGALARRICCWVHKGQELAAGEKYGMIRFGSRVDVFLPSNVDLNVGVGQKVCGGHSVLGRWHN